MGGLVSIPSNPLPAFPKESVQDAIPIYEAILSGWRLFGQTPSLARGLGYLASLYVAVGDAAKAERLYDEAQRILEKHGATGRDLGWVNNNRGLARLDQKRYTEALSSFREAMQALKPEAGELPKPYAITLQNLASAYQLLGDLEASESAYLEALAILRGMGGERDRAYQTTNHNLADLYGSIGDFAAARKILEGLAAQRGTGSSSLRFAILNDLGLALRGLKEFPAAETRLKAAQALTTAGSRERALALTNLAVTYKEAGDPGKAQQEGEEALRLAEALHGAGSVPAAVVEATLGGVALDRGDLTKAERLLTRARTALSRESAGHQQVLAGLDQSLAIVASRQGQNQRALDLSRQAFEMGMRNFDRILAFGSEAQRLAYQSNAFPYDHIANLGQATLLAEAVLRMKGAVLDSLLEERAVARKSASSVDRERLDRIGALKVAVMEELARGEGNPRLDDLERKLKQEETALAKSVQRPLRRERPRADLARVQAALEGDQVLVELVRFQLYTQGGRLVPHYGAVVIPSHGQPAWADLGEAGDLERSIGDLVASMDRTGSELFEGDIAKALRGLYDHLWRPLAKMFPEGTRKVLLSPDGTLHFVPWSALLDEKEGFLTERWQIAQIGSGRDLLREAPVTPPAKTLLGLVDGKGNLPFAKEEIRTVSQMLQNRGWSTEVLESEQAESELLKRHNPGILHFATHSRQLKGEMSQAIEARLSRRPMYRGYLMLGGAERSLQTWKQGSMVPFSEDGILTAEEAGGLDLGRTWLTVLSACETGAGEAKSGEGILGLRRGFALAGTQYLLFTLWSVGDEDTEKFMQIFYEKLFQTWNPMLAFYETQLAELRRLRRENGLTKEVLRDGGFVLTR